MGYVQNIQKFKKVNIFEKVKKQNQKEEIILTPCNFLTIIHTTMTNWATASFVFFFFPIIKENLPNQTSCLRFVLSLEFIFLFHKQKIPYSTKMLNKISLLIIFFITSITRQNNHNYSQKMNQKISSIKGNIQQKSDKHCIYCLEDYSLSKNIVPYIVCQNMHSLCIICIQKVLKSKGSFFECFECRIKTFVKEKEDVNKNRYAIKLMELKEIAQRKELSYKKMYEEEKNKNQICLVFIEKLKTQLKQVTQKSTKSQSICHKCSKEIQSPEKIQQEIIKQKKKSQQNKKLKLQLIQTIQKNLRNKYNFQWDQKCTHANQFKIKGKKITKMSKLLHQINSKDPIPSHRTCVNFRIVQYGQDHGICIGILTKSRLDKYSMGKNQSLGYFTTKKGLEDSFLLGSLAPSDKQKGQILLDGTKIAQADKKYFIQQGKSLRAQVQLSKMTATFIKDGEIVSEVKLKSKWWQQDDIYFYVGMSDIGTCLQVQ